MTARTTAQRQAALRERRKKAGLMEVRGIWLEPELHAGLKLIMLGKIAAYRKKWYRK